MTFDVFWSLVYFVQDKKDVLKKLLAEYKKCMVTY